MAGSRQHMYAGRYDLRVHIEGLGLCLVDLKTSKSTYLETHFPQLEGYELASVEMGFPPTDGGRWLLRTREDGQFVPHDAVPEHRWQDASFVTSWASPETFLGYLAAYRAKTEIASGDPTAAWARRARATLLNVLRECGPALSRDLAEDSRCVDLALDSCAIGRMLGRMKAEGEPVRQVGKRWQPMTG